MIRIVPARYGMPGLRAPAFLFALCAAAALPSAALAQAVAEPPAPATGVPPVSQAPVPGELELAKLVWSTMVGVDHANRSGNYSVLRDNSSTAFQIANDPARLTQIFANLRASRIDLSNTMLVAPIYSAAPQVLGNGVLSVKGLFAMRPVAIYFDLQYQWERGAWRLFGVSVEPRNILQVPPAQPAPPATEGRTRRN